MSQFEINVAAIEDAAEQMEFRRRRIQESQDKIRGLTLTGSRGKARDQARLALIELNSAAAKACLLLESISVYLRTAAQQASEADESLAGLIEEGGG